MSTAPVTCKACGATLAYETDRWVDARSGDDGGTYDICPDAPTFEGRHAPSRDVSDDQIGRLGSVTEAAHALGVDAADVWQMVGSGALRAERSDPSEAWVIYGVIHR